MTLPQFLERLGLDPLGTYKCSRLRNDGGLVSDNTPNGWQPCYYVDEEYFVDLSGGRHPSFHRVTHNMMYHKVVEGLRANRIQLILSYESRWVSLPARVRKITATQAKQIVADEIWASVVDDTSHRKVIPPASRLAGRPTERHEQWWRDVNTEAICGAAALLVGTHGKLKSGAMNLAREVRSSLKTLLDETESGQTETLQEVATLIETLRQTLDKNLSQVNHLRSTVPRADTGRCAHDPRRLTLLTFGCLRPASSHAGFAVDKDYVERHYYRSNPSIKFQLPEDSDLRFPSALHVVNDVWAHFGLPTVQPFGLDVNAENLTKLVVLADAAKQQLLSFNSHASSDTDPQPEPETTNESNPYGITI